MQLDEEALTEFVDLYKKEYGTELTRQEAVEYGTRFIRFVKAVYGNNLPKLKTIDTGINKEDN